MRIVFLSDLEAAGGAAIAASRLAESLVRAGHEVSRIVCYPDRANYPWKTVTLQGSSSRAFRVMRALAPGRVKTTLLERSVRSNLRRLLAELRAEIVHFHNLHSASPLGWSWNLAETAAEFAPVVWTLHDMWSFTGRCSYNFECRKFVSGCDASCPTPAEYPPLSPDLIAGAWNSRRDMFRRKPGLHAVTPSKWLKEQTSNGFWRDFRVEVIPNGLPLNVYRPMDRTVARQALNLDPSQIHVLAAAHSLSDRRQGMVLLREALALLPEKRFTLLTMGKDSPGEIEGIRVHNLGFVRDEALKVLAYNSADLLVHPALQDNFPNVILEGMACGIPAVAFPVGGIPEMVRTATTGMLADSVSATSLAAVMETALKSTEEIRRMSRSCREIAEAEYSVELQRERFLQLYGEVR